MVNTAVLKGYIKPSRVLIGTLSAQGALTGYASIGISGGGGYPKYTGDYKVTAGTYEEKVLPTKGRVLTDNVTCLKIPQFEVSNDSNGKTLIIGEEYFN